jgi:hypothetical protein
MKGGIKGIMDILVLYLRIIVIYIEREKEEIFFP